MWASLQLYAPEDDLEFLSVQPLPHHVPPCSTGMLVHLCVCVHMRVPECLPMQVHVLRSAADSGNLLQLLHHI